MMKKVKFLKTLLDVLFIMLVALVLFAGVAIPFAGLELEFKSDCRSFQDIKWFLWIVICLTIVCYLFFIAGIWYLRRAVSFMFGKDVYKKAIAKNVTKAGKLLVVSGLMGFIIKLTMFVYTIVFKSTTNINFDSDAMLDFLKLITGVFLLILCDYIKKGKSLQEEVNLTI